MIRQQSPVEPLPVPWIADTEAYVAEQWERDKARQREMIRLKVKRHHERLLEKWSDNGCGNDDHRRVYGCADGNAVLGNRGISGGASGGLGLGLNAGRTRPARLESPRNNLTSFVAVVPCRCRCRTCPRCGPALGWKVRQAMLAKENLFRRGKLLTLTVDRKRFSEPAEAHRAISDGSYVPRLLRLLGVKTWMWALEFQQQSGQGWPHWHILIDLSTAKKRIDLKRAWRLWRDKWKLGGLDFSYKKKQPRNRKHAIYYITKYLTKMPKAFPVWVLNSEKRVRFVQGSKSCGSLVGRAARIGLSGQQQPTRPDEEANPFLGVRGEPGDVIDVKRRRSSPLLPRMAKCEQTAVAFHVEGDVSEAKGEWSFLRQLPLRPVDLIDLASSGLISARAAAVEWGQEEVIALCPGIRSLGECLSRLPDELSDRESGYLDWHARHVERRQDFLLREHGRFWSLSPEHRKKFRPKPLLN